MALSIGGTVGDISREVGSAGASIFGVNSPVDLEGQGGFVKDAVRLLAEYQRKQKRPALKPTAPPRTGLRRSGKPFDFFGTLFTTPATEELNPMVLLNQTV